MFSIVSVFSVVLIICGVMFISALNSIHSLLWLMGGFTSAIFLMVLLAVDFIALTLLMVYVGAMPLLFLFVVMLNLSGLSDLLDMSNFKDVGLSPILGKWSNSSMI